MAKRLILIFIIIGLFFSCIKRAVIENPKPQPRYLHTGEPKKQEIFYTNGSIYWGILFPGPANRMLKIVKNFEMHSNIRISNEMIISNQQIQIANSQNIIKKRE